jgi:hypothetical protein
MSKTKRIHFKIIVVLGLMTHTYRCEYNIAANDRKYLFMQRRTGGNWGIFICAIIYYRAHRFNSSSSCNYLLRCVASPFIIICTCNKCYAIKERLMISYI